MDDITKAHRIKLIENNIGSFLALWKDFEGAEFSEGNNGTRIVTGLPFSHMNSVVKAKYAGNIKEEIQKTIEPFIEKKVPVLWWIGPSSKPNNLGTYLEEFEFRLGDSPPGMHMDLNDLDQNYQFPPELRIEEVKETEQLEEWVDVFIAGLGIPVDRRESFLESEKFLLTQENYISFIGYWKNEPVATTALLLDNNVAGLYLIITKPEYRGKKIGSAMTVNALRHAQNIGYKEVILQSSAMGYNIYRRIGFEEYCKFQWYYRKFE